MTKEEFTKLGIHIGYLGQKIQVACMGSPDIETLKGILPKDTVEDLCRSINELRVELYGHGLEEFNKKFIESQKPLNPEDQKLLNDHLWDLT